MLTDEDLTRIGRMPEEPGGVTNMLLDLVAEIRRLRTPVLDTFHGGDPRRFEPDWRSLVGEISIAGTTPPFDLWSEACERAETGPVALRPWFGDVREYETRTLSPHHGPHIWEWEGQIHDRSGAVTGSNFGVGLNHPEPGPWREWAERVRPFVVRARVWWLSRGLERAIERAAVPNPQWDEEELAEGYEQQTDAEWAANQARELAEYRARLANAEAEMAALPDRGP